MKHKDCTVSIEEKNSSCRFSKFKFRCKHEILSYDGVVKCPIAAGKTVRQQLCETHDRKIFQISILSEL